MQNSTRVLSDRASRCGVHSMYASGRLTNSSAWHDVAPYSSPRHSQDIGRPRKRDFEDSTCICLPARSPALRDGGRGIFDQPVRNEFSSRLIKLNIALNRRVGQELPSPLMGEDTVWSPSPPPSPTRGEGDNRAVF